MSAAPGSRAAALLSEELAESSPVAGKGRASSHLCAPTLGSGQPIFFILPPPPPGAEQGAGFQILLLGVLLLVVTCTAVTAVVALTRKVMILAAHPSHGTQPCCLALSRERLRGDLPTALCAFSRVLVLPFCEVVHSLLSLPLSGSSWKVGNVTCLSLMPVPWETD